jgi:nucleotide-binding universal stress UspA family protein
MDGYKPGDLVQRMKDNASVFGAGVRLPHSVRDFACIPGPLLDWFQATFQQATRTAPPSPRDTSKPAKAAQIMRAVTTATGGLVFEKLFERAGDPAVRVWANGAVRLQSGRIVDMATGRHLVTQSSTDCEVMKCASGWLVSYRPDGVE